MSSEFLDKKFGSAREIPPEDPGKNVEAERPVSPRDDLGERERAVASIEPTGNKREDTKNFLKATDRSRYASLVEEGKIPANKVLSDIRSSYAGDESDQTKAEAEALERIQQSESVEGESDAGLDSRQEPSSETPENAEKQERITRLMQRVEQASGDSKVRNFRLENRFDQSYGEAIEKFSRHAERSPQVITPQFIEKLDQKKERVKDGFAESYEIRHSWGETNKNLLASMPVEFLSLEMIGSMEQVTELVISYLEKSDELLDESVSKLEQQVERIPEPDGAPLRARNIEKSARAIRRGVFGLDEEDKGGLKTAG